MTRIIFATLFATALLNGTAQAAAPTAEQIVQWLPEDQVTEVEEIHPLTLKGGEQAYLASVNFPDAGRNFWAGYVLARPALKEARVLEEFGGQYNGVTPGGGPLALIGSAGSGQGTSEATYSVVVFEGWAAKRLYSISESDNSGNCGYDGRPCEGSQVFLHFVPVIGSGASYLSVTEVRYSSTGDEDPAPKVTTRSELVRLLESD